MGDTEEFHDFFTNYGEALATGDLDRVADRYAYPSFVTGDDMSFVVADGAAVVAAFSGAAEQYRERGLVAALPTITGVESLSDALASVDVRWSYTDAAGAEQASESYRYVLRRGAEHPTICVVIPTRP